MLEVKPKKKGRGSCLTMLALACALIPLASLAYAAPTVKENPVLTAPVTQAVAELPAPDSTFRILALRDTGSAVALSLKSSLGEVHEIGVHGASPSAFIVSRRGRNRPQRETRPSTMRQPIMLLLVSSWRLRNTSPLAGAMRLQV